MSRAYSITILPPRLLRLSITKSASCALPAFTLPHRVGSMNLTARNLFCNGGNALALRAVWRLRFTPATKTFFAPLKPFCNTGETRSGSVYRPPA